ncbi:MAG: hypothetical protein ACXU8A_02590 [Burkholderiaceae bacterium]
MARVVSVGFKIGLLFSVITLLIFTTVGDTFFSTGFATVFAGTFFATFAAGFAIGFALFFIAAGAFFAGLGALFAVLAAAFTGAFALFTTFLAVLAAVDFTGDLPAARGAGFAFGLVAGFVVAFLLLVATTLFLAGFLVTVAFIALILFKNLPMPCYMVILHARLIAAHLSKRPPPCVKPRQFILNTVLVP